MAEVNINNFESSDIDLKIEKRIPLICKQYDDVTLNFNVFDYGNPVDLSKYYIEFKIRQPNGNEVTQTSGIIKNNNSIKINCIDEVTAVYGEVKVELDFTSSDNKQKSSFVIVINVKESLKGGIANSSTGVPKNDDIPISYNIDFSKLESYVNEANELSESFEKNTQIFKETQDSLDASVESAKEIADSVKNSIDVANNLNSNLDEANRLDASLKEDITNGNLLKTDLNNLISTASTTKNDLAEITSIASDKLDEINNMTNGLLPRVESIESEIETARNGKSNLLEGIKSLVGTSSGGSSTGSITPSDSETVKNIQAEIESARVGQNSLRLGIQAAIDKAIENIDTKMDSVNIDLKNEIEAARMGENTLKLGIQGTVKRAIDGIDTMVENLNTKMDDKYNALNREISDARNGELTLKAGINKVVNTVKEELEKEISSKTTGIDEELRNQVAVACEGYGSLQGKLSDMTSTINDNADKVSKYGKRIDALDGVCDSFKDGANITVKQGVQNMIDASINGITMPEGSITVEQIDALNANMMNVIICTEKSFGKSFFGLTDNMRVYSFANIDSNVVIKNGIYDKENKCIRSNGTIIESVAFCYD